MSASFPSWALPPGVPDPGPAEDRGDGLGRLRLEPEGVRALAAALRAARPRALAAFPVRERAAALGRAGARFLDPLDPVRQESEEAVASTAGLSVAMAKEVITGMARDWTEARLLALLAAELPDPDVLERFVWPTAGTRGANRVRASAPALSVHIGSGTVPGVTVTSLVRALLVGSAALAKPGRGDVALPVLFARALAQDAPALAEMAAVVYWDGGTDALEQAVLAEADAVVVYGEDATVRRVRDRLPVTTRLVAYHHRTSVALVGGDLDGPGGLAAAAADGARAVALFDRRGCVSPSAFFVEDRGGARAAGFTVELAQALDRLDRALPAGPRSAAEASAVHQLRGTAELRAAAGQPVRVYGSRDASWTVVLEPPGPPAPCAGRTVRVHPVADLEEAVGHLAPLAAHLQTVGMAGVGGDRGAALAGAFAALGASRVCSLSAVSFPPPWWHHDGQGPLRALLRWTDLEA